MRFFSAIALVSFFANSTFAASPICYANITQFNAVKSKLPEPFRKMPVAMANVNRVFKIFPADDGAESTFKHVNVFRVGGPKEQAVEKICWNRNEMTIHFTNGKTEEGSYDPKSKLYHFQFLDFESADVKEFNKVVYGNPDGPKPASAANGAK